jgi:hypothetical protein
MRNLSATVAGAAVVLTMMGHTGVRAGPPVGGDAFQASLQALLSGGLEQRTELVRLSPHAEAVRRARPGDAVADYVLALASLKRLQNDEATGHLRRALQTDPTHLPSWRVLLRQRLVHGEGDALRSDLVALAAAAAKPQLGWPADGREQAAGLLGRVLGFLALPGVDILPPDQLAGCEQAVRKRLGAALADALQAGQQKLAADRKAVAAELAGQAKEIEARAQKRSEAARQDIEDRKEDAADRRDDLRLSAADWKTWIQDQLDKADDELKKLERDYQTIGMAGRQVAGLMTRAEIEIGRRQTALELQGVRGQRANMDPILLQLQQDYLALLSRRQACERQAATALLQARTVMATRAAAVLRFERATGEIVQQRARLSQWEKRLQKSQAQAVDQADATGQVQSLAARASMPSSYFPLDYEQERAAIEKQYGLK